MVQVPFRFPSYTLLALCRLIGEGVCESREDCSLSYFYPADIHETSTFRRCGNPVDARLRGERRDLRQLRVTPIQDSHTAMRMALLPSLAQQEFIRLAGGREARASVNTFLLQGDGRTILIDTGNGRGIGKTVERLREQGVAPEQVDAILITHMHGDHIGGLLDGDGQAVFPKAELYISGPERAY